MAMLANQTGKRMGNMGAARANYPRRVLLPMLLAVGLFLASCGRGATPARVPQVVPTPVGALVGSLEDESRDLPDGRVAWHTYWRLCWGAYPGATAYELQARTGEGVSPQLRRQDGTCFRLEAAAGEDTKADLPRSRTIQLSTQSGQLAYRVRAVLGPDRVSAWSESLAVGTTGAP